MSTDKYPSIFSHQMEAIVTIICINMYSKISTDPCLLKIRHSHRSVAVVIQILIPFIMIDVLQNLGTYGNSTTCCPDDRGYYLSAWIYEISLRVMFHLFTALTREIFFNTQRENSYLQAVMK